MAGAQLRTLRAGAASPMRVTSRGFPRDSWSHGDFPAVTPVGIYSSTVFQYLLILGYGT